MKNRGFIRYIILIVILLLILSFFNVSIRELVFSETSKENFAFLMELLNKVWDFIVSIWDSYFSPWLSYIWENVFVRLYEWVKGIFA